MTVTLKPDVERLVEEKIRAGEFLSVEDAVNELVSRALEDEKLSDEDLAELRAEVDIGIAQADRGEFVEFTAQDVIAERRAARAARQQGT